jgi:hypothetical protein
MASLPEGERPAAGWGSVRRHVVKHDWRSIRDALFVGRNEHMSDVDDCVSVTGAAWVVYRLTETSAGRRVAVLCNDP